jgi:hypothetical protein
MSKLMLAAFAVVLIALSFHTLPVAAQPTLAEIQRMYDSATTTDPDIERFLPRWRIQEADLKIKIAQYFKLEGYPVRDNDSIIVTATFPKPGSNEQDLLSIRVGSRAVLSGTQQIRAGLGEAIYTQVVERSYAHTAIEPSIPETQGGTERIGNVMQPANARQFVAISAFRQAVQLGTSGVRLEHWLGNDEIGYHFWSSGQGKGLISYPIIPLHDADLRAMGVPDIFTVMLGAAYRMSFGTPTDKFLGGIISPRLLNGAIGTKAVARVDFRVPAETHGFGVSVNTEIPFNKLEGGQVANMNDGSIVFIGREKFGARAGDSVDAAYFLRTVAQGNVFWETWLNDYEHFFRVSLGASYQEFAKGAPAFQDGSGRWVPIANQRMRDTATPAGIAYIGLSHPFELEDWIYAKVEYLNQSGFPFGAGVQLANRNLLLTGFIPVVPNWLFIEAKYSTPILRDRAAPWEQSPFFMISPILRFKID